ncbi:hypothetical protein QQZ08_005367 [Neonectria magnoliae]|uniref:Uncharacterized protein n=1 Tax=Neonectria magnoliae TaxID=2732573 RepID=A0ABR1I3K1_9HYPO
MKFSAVALASAPALIRSRTHPSPADEFALQRRDRSVQSRRQHQLAATTATGTATDVASANTTLSTDSTQGDSTSTAFDDGTESGFVQSTSTGDDAGAMPTAAVAMGALVGGAAILVNL